MNDEMNYPLQELEEIHRILLDKSPDPIFYFSSGGRYLYVNRAFAEGVGKSVDQIIGKTIWDVFDREEADKRFAALDHVFQSGLEKVIEVRVPRADGDKYFITTITPVIDNQGNVVNAICSSKDITDRKRAEEALVNSEQSVRLKLDSMKELQRQMEQIIEHLPDATFVINQQGQVIFWNKAIEEMTGIPKEQMIGRGNYEYAIPFYGERRSILIDLALLHCNQYGILKNKYDFIRHEGNTLLGEIYVPNTYQGKGAYLLGSASKLWDLQGNAVGAIESIRDITDRKNAETDLLNEKERLKAILLSVGDGVVVTDRNANVELLNQVAEQLTGWTQNDAYSKPFEEVFHMVNENTGERCGKLVDKVLDNGSIIGLANHTILVSRDGVARPIEDSAASIKDKDGNITGVVMVFRDFTEKKERQEKIKYLSYHDQLTGLYNRRFYEEELSRLDTERNFPITLVMADVNGLKLTNDAFGHKAGDILLKKISEIIKRECRSDDIVARIGGDEFVILLPRTDSQQAEVIVKRINDTIFKEPANTIIMSVSFGWETKRNGMEDMAAVFKKAEDDMYRRKLSESSSMRYKTIEVIIKTLHEKNAREQLHSTRVSQLCQSIGGALGLSGEDISELRTVGLVHDIGKITLDDRILEKDGTLSDIEWIEIKRHSETGYRILSSVNEFAPLAEYVLAHHERWDGRGYPNGLKGERIPLEARIIAISDAYDAMTCDRPYRKALKPEAALQEIKRNAGTQFDPEIARVFVEKVLGKEW